MATKNQPSRLTEAILDIAGDMHQAGIVDDEGYRKITLRHLGDKAQSTAQPITGEEIRTLREREHLSQAVFARYLNLTTGYVSQLERGTKTPKGPALALLNVIRRKGVEALR